MKKTILLCLALAMMAVAAGLGVWFLSRQRPLETETKEQIVAGQTIYATNCASCHGARLEGETNWKVRKENGRLPAPPHDSSGHTWHHPDNHLFGIVKEGLGPYAPAGYATDMPAFKGILSDAQIRAVLAYIKSSWPPDIRERQRKISAQAD
jgi:mono/diheme cytochrome c family protein